MWRRLTIGSGRFVSSFSSEPHAHQQGPSPNYLHRSVSYVLLFWAHNEPLFLSLSLSPFFFFQKTMPKNKKRKEAPSNHFPTLQFLFLFDPLFRSAVFFLTRIVLQSFSFICNLSWICLYTRPRIKQNNMAVLSLLPLPRSLHSLIQSAGRFQCRFPVKRISSSSFTCHVRPS